jgi:hypothetical protein
LAYYTTFIDINRAEVLADAIEAKAASLGLKVVNNDAQIVGSKQRADGGNVCRYAVKFLNSIGKVSWSGFEPVELPNAEEKPGKKAKTRKEDAPQPEAVAA